MEENKPDDIILFGQNTDTAQKTGKTVFSGDQEIKRGQNYKDRKNIGIYKGEKGKNDRTKNIFGSFKI